MLLGSKSIPWHQSLQLPQHLHPSGAEGVLAADPSLLTTLHHHFSLLNMQATAVLTLPYLLQAVGWKPTGFVAPSGS